MSPLRAIVFLRRIATARSDEADVACQSSKRSMSGTSLHPVPPAALPLCLQSSGAWDRRAFRPWTGRCDRRAASRNTRRRSHSHRPNSRASLPFCPHVNLHLHPTPAAYKGHKVCAYELCPSPMHSSKWRIVTEGTSAGGRDWDALVGKTLCDSCYSTFRKHGTFARSIRTNDGWSRSVQAGTIGKRPALATGPLHEAKSKPSPKPTMSRSQPSPKRPRTQSAAPKLPAVASAATSGTSNGALPKRKAAMKAAGSWRVAGGDKGGAVDRQVEAELLDAVAILRSMQRSSYASSVTEAVAASRREQSRSPAPLQTGSCQASEHRLSASPDANECELVKVS